jgi:hypothetical protein
MQGRNETKDPSAVTAEDDVIQCARLMHLSSKKYSNAMPPPRKFVCDESSPRRNFERTSSLPMISSKNALDLSGNLLSIRNNSREVLLTLLLLLDPNDQAHDLTELIYVLAQEKTSLCATWVSLNPLCTLPPGINAQSVVHAASSCDGWESESSSFLGATDSTVTRSQTSP